jgi:DNA repair protein RadA/Sms
VQPTRLAHVVERRDDRLATGVAEFDRVLGGGLVPGSTTLLFGEPGIGKSTLALMASLAVASRGGDVLIVAAEESASQVADRARRLGDVANCVDIVVTNDVDGACALIGSRAPHFVVVDSVSALRDDAVAGSVGSVAQVRHAAQRLCAVAKESSSCVLLVGHVTKDGELSGPRALEHLVDTVVRIEGDRYESLRVLRAVKHRFGSTEEIGLFEMSSAGLRTLRDPSLTLLNGEPTLSGVAVTVTSEGSRSLLVPIQALVASCSGSPRRVAHGVSAQRLALLLAVLDARCGVSLHALDVFTATGGGLPAVEPAADVAIALAVTSAAHGFAVPSGVVALGEVGLTGELRSPTALARRVREAARRGATRVLVPTDAENEVGAGVDVVRCGTLRDVLSQIRSLETGA